MKVRHDEGVATRIGPEPCGAIREGCVEASVGERIGQPLSRESLKVSGADVVGLTEGNMDGCVIEVSARFVIFCTVAWTDHEHSCDHAASSRMLRGLKPSWGVLAWLQR